MDAAASPGRLERGLLWSTLATVAALAALVLAYMGSQEPALRRVVLAVAPLPPLLGAASCVLGARRDRRLWWPAGAFLLGLPFVVDAWTRSRFRLGEENCGAPGPLPYGWDHGVVDNVTLALWPLGGFLALAGLVLFAWPAWRPAAWRMALAGVAAAALSGWMLVRCAGT